MRSVHCVVVLIVALRSVYIQSSALLKEVSGVFESLGFSPICIANALALCESSTEGSVKQNLTNNNDTWVPKIMHSLEKKIVNYKARNCDEVLSLGVSTSGVQTVYPYECCRGRKVIAYCDQTTDGGGWTVIQNRVALPIREDFYRTWVEYAVGFGNITGEFWLGLDNIHALVGSSLMELRIDLEDYDGNKRWAKYGVFFIGDAASKYVLSIGRYVGDAGDGMVPSVLKYVANDMQFSTYDKDNDNVYPTNCAMESRGAWWYRDCHHSNLNGYQHIGAHSSHADGINWYPFRQFYYSLKKANMKVRPVFRLRNFIEN